MRVNCLIPLTAIAAIAFAAQASAEAMVREQKVITSAGARAMVDACTAWAEHNHMTLAMSRPIVAIVCMASSSESWEPQPAPTSWHSGAGRSRPQHHKWTWCRRGSEHYCLLTSTAVAACKLSIGLSPARQTATGEHAVASTGSMN